MTKIVNIMNWAPYIQPQHPIQQLNEAIECLLTYWIVNTNFILNLVTSHQSSDNPNSLTISPRIATEQIQYFLSKTRITANLLSGNYESALKMLAPIIHDSKWLFSDLPYRNMIIALLARLKKQNKIQWKMPRISQDEIALNTMVDAFLSRDGNSPNDAISIPISWQSSSAKQVA